MTRPSNRSNGGLGNGLHTWAALVAISFADLEELCEDRQAAGGDLKARIGALRAKVVLPTELFDAMDELRILGNDAAHVEAKIYDNIGEPQVSIALELTKEILKATYQLDTLVKKIQALKGKP